jgi:hypothetical protein
MEVLWEKPFLRYLRKGDSKNGGTLKSPLNQKAKEALKKIEEHRK